ncbi:SUF system Fe-S cluster assembly protein [Paraburkholderia lycopersici]|uniref:FeS assembly SUF system protein n=1 Tax=Paraburkholderia lycopersici TaxID=416944 RepID=A0A1G7ASA5_9BURK|nr:SUF system Fe-S cluster assembly protein [Paraburkholderia lycopersici]SDE17580.1 FeS assembly SUF system protein [Paraburkholderia lycopersici]
MDTRESLEKRGGPEFAAGALRERVIDALRTVFDPEIPVNIYDLGLVYELDVDAQTGSVSIHMTLTAPGCPVAQTFPATVEQCVDAVEGVSEARVELVWDPPWTRARMSEAALLQLGML